MDVCLQGIPREPIDVHALSIAKRASRSIDPPHYACIDFYTLHLGTNFTHCILVCAIYSVSIGERGKTYGNKIMRAPVDSGQLGTEAKAVKYMFVLRKSSALLFGFSKYTHLFLERCFIFSRDVVHQGTKVDTVLPWQLSTITRQICSA